MLLLPFRVGEQVCASYPSDTVYPKTRNASAPKAHASRLPIANVSHRLTLQVHRDYALIKIAPPPSRGRVCLVGCHGLLLACLESASLLRLPFISDTVSNGRVCGAVERGRPRHSGLFQSRSVAGVHGVGALHVPVVMPIGVGVSPVLDFDRGAGLPPEMLRGLESRLSFPGNRERQGQAFLRARRRFHHSATQRNTKGRKKKGQIRSELSG